MLYAGKPNWSVLVSGDKSDEWTGWNKLNIPIADEHFDEHQDKIRERRCKAAKDEQEANPERQGTKMSMKVEERVLSRPGVHKRVAEIEDGLRLTAGLTGLREQVGLSA